VTGGRPPLPVPPERAAADSGVGAGFILSCTQLKLFAHPDEEGSTVDFMGKTYTLEVIKDGCFDDLDIALFSAGGDISTVRYAAAAMHCRHFPRSPISLLRSRGNVHSHLRAPAASSCRSGRRRLLRPAASSSTIRPSSAWTRTHRSSSPR
jgi:hypothetical protein